MASAISNARFTADAAGAGEPEPPDRYELADYGAIVRRHWWVVVVGVLLGIAAGGGVTWLQPRVYESTTSVLMLPTGSDEATVAGSRTKGAINPDTEARLVTSVVVARRARDLLHSSTDPADLREQVSVEVPPSTSILDITFAAGDPREAQAGSQAFAQAYLANRVDNARAELAEQVKAVRSRITQLQTELQRLTDQISRLSPESSRRAYLETQRGNLATELASLTSRLNQLETTRVLGGRIISDAQLPAAPSRPLVALNLAGAATAGLLAGLLAAYLREQYDSRLRRGVDVERRAGVPLLVELPARPRLTVDDAVPATGVRGRLFDRLRNEVAAALPDGHRLVVVTSASPGAAATLVSANLASAFARAGNDVTLVCGQVSTGAAAGGMLSRLLRVAPVPGLSDVLRGFLTLDEATQSAPRHPGLRVVAAGGANGTAGLPPEALRELFAELRRSGRYVIVDAPSTAVSADAQRLGVLADAAIVAVERRRTRHREVRDAVEQLRRVGTPLLGAVVLGRVTVPAALPTATPAGRKLERAAKAAPATRVSTVDQLDATTVEVVASVDATTGAQSWAIDTPTLVFGRSTDVIDGQPVPPRQPDIPWPPTGGDPAGGKSRSRGSGRRGRGR